MKNTSRSLTGFTLIELLVVIAIIAILAAILFPVFAQAREKARAITCVSNEKQIGLACMMYTQDYDEVYPLSWDEGGSWVNAVDPYIKSAGVSAWALTSHNTVWQCPDDTTGDTVSYSANPMLLGGGAPDWGFPIVPSATLGKVNAPSDCVLAGESIPGYGANGQVINDPTTFTDPVDDLGTTDTNDTAVQYYHNLLHIDMTTEKPGFVACPSTIAINWPGGAAAAQGCKEISWRHSRGGQNSGVSNMIFADGHSKAIHFGQSLPHNWFPQQLTPTQTQTWDN
ncbi:MAG TPA: DUF1559 domain-containing protein [Capsulimonadaceae bacterium]|nr:DUF1559 domain-containing protein [Capsulimonadaceae bacterium]